MGKTTVSRLLASKLNAMHVNLTELAKKERLFLDMDKKRETLIIDTNRVLKRIYEVTKDAKQDIIIIDGHYAVYVVQPKDVDLVFVLRRNPDELKRTLHDRGFGERKLWENLFAEVLDVCLFDAIELCGLDKICEIDVSDKEVKDVLNETILALERKKECKVGIVDWLGLLHEEGKLETFLKAF